MWWLFLACTSSDGTDITSPVDTAGPEPVAPLSGDLLIEELYTCGAPPAGGADHYYSDQFIELVNTADWPLDLSGVLLGDVFGSAGVINPGMTPDSFRAARPDEVVLATVWQIPEGVVLPPGQTLVIAHDGANHRPFSSVDLSGAGLEAYVKGPRDEDSATVDNLVEVHFDGGYDWLMTVFGPSVVVVEAGTELTDVEGPYSTLHAVPASAVLDGVDTLMDADSGVFKRLPDAVDQSHTFVSDVYVGESVHRKRTGDVFVDTNDSANDFEIGPPSPSFRTRDGVIEGDAFVELGAGTQGFEALDNGDSVVLVTGPQGGYHVDVALRFGGIGPGGITLVYDAVDASTAEVVSFVTQGTVSDSSVVADGEDWVRLGDRVVMDVASPDEVVGRELVLRVTAATGGSTWSDERVVRVVQE